jgi:AmiR/NasT family two-component response regulator
VTNSLKAYELDSLKPNQLLEEVEEAIKNCIDINLLNDEIEKYNNDLDEIETIRKKFTLALVG